MCDGTCLQYLQEWSLVNWALTGGFQWGFAHARVSVV